MITQILNIIIVTNKNMVVLQYMELKNFSLHEKSTQLGITFQLNAAKNK